MNKEQELQAQTDVAFATLQVDKFQELLKSINNEVIANERVTMNSLRMSAIFGAAIVLYKLAKIEMDMLDIDFKEAKKRILNDVVDAIESSILEEKNGHPRAN